MQEIQEAREIYPAVLFVMKFGSANYKVASLFLCIALCAVDGVAIFVFCFLCWLLVCVSCSLLIIVIGEGSACWDLGSPSLRCTSFLKFPFVNMCCPGVAV